MMQVITLSAQGEGSRGSTRPIEHNASASRVDDREKADLERIYVRNTLFLYVVCVCDRRAFRCVVLPSFSPSPSVCARLPLSFSLSIDV